MFTMDKVELNRLNRRPGLPKPGRVHGSGGRLRGKKDDKYIDVRNPVNKLNPALRGQTNMISGRFIEEHESDSDKPVLMARSTYNTGQIVPIVQTRHNRPLRCRVK